MRLNPPKLPRLAARRVLPSSPVAAIRLPWWTRTIWNEAGPDENSRGDDDRPDKPLSSRQVTFEAGRTWEHRPCAQVEKGRG